MFEVFPRFHPTKFASYCEMWDDGGSDFGNSSGGSSASNTSLVTAIGGDITQLGTAFIAEQGAVTTAKAVAKSPNAAVLVYGGVAIAALVVLFLLFKK